jgi:type I restriction enzyme S subunit
VRCRAKEDAFFVWAVLATEPGYYAAIGTAYGSSIPSLDCALLADLRIPWWSDQRREVIVSLVSRMITALSEAIDAERQAVALVEVAVEETP